MQHALRVWAQRKAGHDAGNRHRLDALVIQDVVHQGDPIRALRSRVELLQAIDLQGFIAGWQVGRSILLVSTNFSASR
jgi:hypothetical protein